MSLKKCVAGLMAAAMPMFAESTAGININSDDIEIAGKYELGSGFFYDNRASRNFLHASYLYSGESGTRGDNLLEAGYLATGRLGTLDRVRFGIGLKTALSKDYVALPIGVSVRYEAPLQWPVGIEAEYYVAPDPLVFSHGDGYSAYRFGVDVKLIPDAAVYAGYRNINLEYKEGRQDFNDGWYAGVRFFF